MTSQSLRMAYFIFRPSSDLTISGREQASPATYSLGSAAERLRDLEQVTICLWAQFPYLSNERTG